MKYFKFSDPVDKQWYYICLAEDQNYAKLKYINAYDEPPHSGVIVEELDFSQVFSGYLKDVGMNKKFKKLILEKLPEVKELVDEWVKENEVF